MGFLLSRYEDCYLMKEVRSLEKLGWIRAQSTAPASLKLEEKDPNERETKRGRVSVNVNLE